MEERKVSESESVISRVMMPPDANLAGNVFGGSILKMIDEISGIVATRHCRRNVVTASIEHMDFLYPVHIGNLVTLKARMNFVGRTSMEVGVKVYAENLENGDLNFTGNAIITLVSLDESGRPVEVPRLIVETEEDKALFQEGHERWLNRNERQKKLSTKNANGNVK
ncbi:MAG: acyl-CoA thioesterase [Candidatus Thermoplasmatota archaeon]|jgi:acyl-CoA hydrolase|nr:acyl-CoA thioesterase [Candidatus Thermoplasmatota archaeon]